MSFDGIKRAALERITAGSEGARLIGSQLTGVTGNNIQVLLEALLARVLPSGGTTGQVLKKTSGTDYAASWQAESATTPASETASGVAEIATQTETNTGTDDVRIVTPLKLASRTALDTRAGVVELATDAETQTGTDTARAITPANLSARSATETRTGVAEIATQAEADAGTDDARIMTPLKIATRPQKNSVFETHIQGLQLTWNTPGNNGNLLTVSSGSAWIPSLGRVYNVPSTITGPTQTLGASAFHYVYLYDNSGTPAIEISTTAPPAPYKGNARTKTSDTSRRFIGAVLTDATGTPVMRPFVHLGDEMIYTSLALSSPYRVLNGAGPGVSNTTQSLAAICPPGVTTDILAMLTVVTGATAGLCMVEYFLTAGSRVGILGVYISSASQFGLTTATLPVLTTTPSFIYSTTGPSGSTFYVDVSGYKFVR